MFYNWRKLLNSILLIIVFISLGIFSSGHANLTTTDDEGVELSNLPSPEFPTFPDYSNNNSNINYNDGTLQFGLEQNTLYGITFNSKVSKRLGNSNAIAIEWDYGKDENRLGATWGILLTPSQLFKLTAERLSEELDFDFVTGSVQEKIPQYAYGMTYEYIFPQSRINDINLNIYYANAQSKTLNPIDFFQLGGEYIDYRHIAGATSKGVSIGTDIQPWSTAALGLALNYDQVIYNAIYNLRGTSENNENFGGTINFEQLILKNIKVDLSGSKREIYDEYTGGISWLLPQLKDVQPELKLSVDRVISHNSISNNTSYLLNLNLNFDRPQTEPQQYYSSLSFARNNDIVAWTNTPAVYMSQVLATADEKLQKVQLVLSSVSPDEGPDAGGTDITLSGEGFAPGADVTFGSDGLSKTATQVRFVNSQTLLVTTPPHSSGPVNITVTNPDGRSVVMVNGFDYSNIPNPTHVYPSSGPIAGNTSVTISGNHFTDATQVTFGGVPATNFSVVNDTTITCTTPSHAAGAVDVAVTAPYGTGTLTNGYTYAVAPTPSGVNPSAGPIGGGTSVTISGSNFTGVTGVTFDGVAATNINVSAGGTSLTCTTPAHVAGTVDVAVTGPGGTGTLTNGYAYAEAPNLTGVTPSSGSTAGGTPVTISGNNLSGATGVTFDGVPATNVIVVNGNTITANTPAHAAGTVDVAVIGPGGTGTLTNGYTYFDSPSPTGVNPSSGPTAGGTSVTISGSNFTGVTGVTFDGVAATNINVNAGGTSLTCTTPTHAAGGTVDVAVTGPGGTGTLTNGYTYAEAPNPTGVDPSSGPTAGGTSVTISGSNFTGVTGVTFDGVAATNINVNAGGTSLTCTTPAHAGGTVDIVVTGPGGTGTLTNGYTYFDSPSPTGVNPSSGPTAGGTSVTISGSNFTGVTEVTFGGDAATNVNVSPTGASLTCTTPAHAAGAVDVAVTGLGGTGTLTNGYTYFDSPSPTGVNPSSGPIAGGTSVTISGSNFTGVTEVTFGGDAATNVNVNPSGTSITCTSPAHAAGTVDVVVTGPGGTGTLTNGYTFFDSPNPTGVEPSSGPTAGGTSVTISGTNFTGATAVTFGGTAATNVNVSATGTSLTCTTPAHAAGGTVDVAVTGPGGTGTLTNGYTYVEAPAPTGVLPSSGLSTGFIPVTISGSNFTGVTGVTFGGTAATNVIVLNATTITCLTPAHALGAVNVAVTGPGGTGTLVNGFTYVLVRNSSKT